jgi:hypothetical protein
VKLKKMQAAELAHMVLNREVLKDGLEVEVLTSLFEILIENGKINENSLMVSVLDALLEWDCADLECGC